MYFYFAVKRFGELNRRQFSHIDTLFDVGNGIVELYLDIERNRSSLLQFSLARLLIYELDTWRYGLKTLSRKKFGFLDIFGYVPCDHLEHEFHARFGRVREHRNVLAHYNAMLFDNQDPAPVKPKEFTRIGAPIEVAPGASVSGFHCNFVGDRFCSSDQKGRINEVYSGPSLPRFVHELLGLLCEELSRSGHLSISVVSGLTYDASRDLRGRTQDWFLHGGDPVYVS